MIRFAREVLREWRTVLTASFVAVLQGVAFAYGSHRGWTLEGATAFSSFCTASSGMVLGVAVKASVEALGGGSGLRGAVAALMTDAKPGEPAQPKGA